MLSKACASPFLPLFERYDALEMDYLSARFGDAPMAAADSLGACLDVVEEALAKVKEELDAALQRLRTLEGSGLSPMTVSPERLAASAASAHDKLVHHLDALVHKAQDALLGRQVPGSKDPPLVAGAAKTWENFPDTLELLAKVRAHADALEQWGSRLGVTSEEHFDRMLAGAKDLSRAASGLAARTASAVIDAHLASVPTLAVWCDPSAPPEFSMAAQGYVTAVGEHLLMLPQHLEVAPAGALPVAGMQPWTDEAPFHGDDSLPLDQQWLAMLAEHVVARMLASVAQIDVLSAVGERRLLVDVSYLRMVLCEGLGASPDARLEALETAIATGGVEALARDPGQVPATVATALARARSAGTEVAAAEPDDAARGAGAPRFEI